MTIYLKNKHTLQVDDFYFRCAIGKNGSSINKIEGDKKTPKGHFNIGSLYYRKNRIKIPETYIKCIKITPQMGWSDDVKVPEKYNKLIKTNQNIHHEKLYRNDNKYDLLIPIKYNTKKRIPGKGSCIFIHLTKNYKPTVGCIVLKKKDFLIMLRIINKNTKIEIS